MAIYKSFLRWKRNSGESLGQDQDFIQEVVNNNTFVTELTENNEFITNVTEHNTFVTNVTNQINANINGKKGVASQLASLDANGKVVASQLGLSSAGDMIIGGAGTPTGYTDVLAGLSGSGSGTVSLNTNMGAGGWQAAWTDGSRTTYANGPTVIANSTFISADLTTTRSIGRFRFAQQSPAQFGNNAASNPTLQSSNDGVSWTTRWSLANDGPALGYPQDVTSTAPDTGRTLRDYGTIELPLPINARYWRMYIPTASGQGSGNGWDIAQFELYEVQVESGTAGSPTRLAPPTDQRMLKFDPAVGPQWVAMPPAVINFVIDGGGSAITTGFKGFAMVPFDCTVVGVDVLANVSGSLVVDIWRDSYANHPPVDADSITASAPPTLSSAIKSRNDTLTGWTTQLNEGDILGFNVDSAATVTSATVVLRIEHR